MKKIRQLAQGIFFKIFLGFLLLSFALFGVSNYLLNGSGSWVAKVDGKTISATRLQKAMQSDREIILRSNPNNPQAMQYVESVKFKSDVLSRIVNNIIMEKLRADFGVEASRSLILQAVAKDPQFQKDGKFDHAGFKQFLAQNGLDEDKYIKAVQDEIVGAMIISSMSLISPIDGKIAAQMASLKEEKRVADIITVSSLNLPNQAAPSPMELNEFYEKNKDRYTVPQMRLLSYLTVDRKELSKNIFVSEKEISIYYETNKDKYTKEETRNFYHLLFSDEKKAENFTAELKSQPLNKQNFANLAKSKENKDQKAITLKNVKKSDLIPELSNNIFNLKTDEVSAVLKSPFGYHVFLLTDIVKGDLIPLANVRAEIRSDLLNAKTEQEIQKRISQIDDTLLASNSLEETAKKLNLKKPALLGKIDQMGRDAMGQEIALVKAFDDLAANAFKLKENETSKLHYSKSNDVFYALKVEKIEEAYQRKFEEVQANVAQLYIKEQKAAKLKDLANNIGQEIKNDPNQALQIVAKNNLKLEKNKEYSRYSYLVYQGRKIPYSSKFAEELFSIPQGSATNAIAQGADNYQIGILKSIKKTALNDAQISAAKTELSNNYKTEFLSEFNRYLQKKYPIKVNEKLLTASEKGATEK